MIETISMQVSLTSDMQSYTVQCTCTLYNVHESHKKKKRLQICAKKCVQNNDVVICGTRLFV